MWFLYSEGSQGTCRVPDRLRGLAECADEAASHALPIAESRLVRHGFNRKPPLFEHEPRRLQPQILDRLGRRQAGFCPEYAAELPRAQAGGLGEPVHGKLRAQITSGKLKRSLYPIRTGVQIQKRRVLRLSARSTMMQDEQPGSLADFFPADVALHQSERQVKAGRHSSGSPDLAISDKYPIRFHRNLRIAALKLFGVEPVSCRAAAVEQARLAQDKSSDADRSNSPRFREHAPQERDKFRWRRSNVGRRPDQ